MLKDILLNNIHMVAPLVLIGAFILVYVLIPKILWIVQELKLTDNPDERSSHKIAIPTMAGVSFFITLILILVLIKIWDTEFIALNIIAALTIIFVIGFKDDLVVSSPKVKIIGQLVAILFIFLSGVFKNISLNGFLGFYHMPTIVSFLFLTFIMLAIINSYNLIDGVDGLAATIGIVVFIVYALIFFATGLYFYGLLSSSLIGILSAYLVYNFSDTKKIFMGDTGSLIIGFCISFFTLKFLSMDATSFGYSNFEAHDKLLLAFVILYIPFFDTSRVIGIRLLQKKSPFYPDRNHIHHILIDAGLSHKKTSLLLGCINLILIGMFLFLSTHLNSFLLLCILIGSYVLFLVVFYILKQKISNKKPFEIL